MLCLLTGEPAFPVSPFSPFAPVAPMKPISPFIPGGPSFPGGPLGPGGPTSPGLPRGPYKNYFEYDIATPGHQCPWDIFFFFYDKGCSLQIYTLE